MTKKEKMLEITNKLNAAIAKTKSNFHGHVEFGNMENGTYMVSLIHFDNRYKNEVSFIMIFDHDTEEQMNNDLLLALDVINYNRLIREVK